MSFLENGFYVRHLRHTQASKNKRIVIGWLFLMLFFLHTFFRDGVGGRGCSIVLKAFISALVEDSRSVHSLFYPMWSFIMYIASKAFVAKSITFNVTLIQPTDCICNIDNEDHFSNSWQNIETKRVLVAFIFQFFINIGLCICNKSGGCIIIKKLAPSTQPLWCKKKAFE